MKQAFMIVLAALPLLGACATDPYTGRPDLGQHMMGGALIGAAAGALAGGAMGGYAIPGAAAGMVAGGAIGAASSQIKPARRYQRDTRGYCYYVDQSGRPVYNYNVTC